MHADTPAQSPARRRCCRCATSRRSSRCATASSRRSTASRSTSSAGKTLCVVGESGSGKSVTARSILQIVDAPGRIVGGSMHVQPRRRHARSTSPSSTRAAARSARSAAREIAMIFQEPMSSLSPVHTIGNQIVEVLRLHLGMSKTEARARAIELLQPGRDPAARNARSTATPSSSPAACASAR